MQERRLDRVPDLVGRARGAGHARR
jgi:hypothetical protein